jgi:hypothetical protein
MPAKFPAVYSLISSTCNEIIVNDQIKPHVKFIALKGKMFVDIVISHVFITYSLSRKKAVHVSNGCGFFSFL